MRLFSSAASDWYAVLGTAAGEYSATTVASSLAAIGTDDEIVEAYGLVIVAQVLKI